MNGTKINVIKINWAKGCLLGVLMIFSQLNLMAQHPTMETFNFSTGKVDTFVVPAGVFALDIEATGANGGAAGNVLGGKGGFVKGDSLNVIPGDTLLILVGQDGASGKNDAGAGGGGGGSFVFKKLGNGTLTPLLIAGGGGGASIDSTGNVGGLALFVRGNDPTATLLTGTGSGVGNGGYRLAAIMGTKGTQVGYVGAGGAGLNSPGLQAFSGGEFGQGGLNPLLATGGTGGVNNPNDGGAGGFGGGGGGGATARVFGGVFGGSGGGGGGYSGGLGGYITSTDLTKFTAYSAAGGDGGFSFISNDFVIGKDDIDGANTGANGLVKITKRFMKVNFDFTIDEDGDLTNDNAAIHQCQAQCIEVSITDNAGNPITGQLIDLELIIEAQGTNTVIQGPINFMTNLAGNANQCFQFDGVNTAVDVVVQIKD